MYRFRTCPGSGTCSKYWCIPDVHFVRNLSLSGISMFDFFRMQSWTVSRHFLGIICIFRIISRHYFCFPNVFHFPNIFQTFSLFIIQNNGPNYKPKFTFNAGQNLLLVRAKIHFLCGQNQIFYCSQIYIIYYIIYNPKLITGLLNFKLF